MNDDHRTDCVYCDELATATVTWQRTDGSDRVTTLCTYHKGAFLAGQDSPQGYAPPGEEWEAFKLGQCTPEDVRELSPDEWVDDDTIRTICPRCGREIKLDAENDTTMSDHCHCSDCQRDYVSGALAFVFGVLCP